METARYEIVRDRRDGREFLTDAGETLQTYERVVARYCSKDIAKKKHPTATDVTRETMAEVGKIPFAE